MCRRHGGFYWWAIIAALISATGVPAAGPRLDAISPIQSAAGDPQDPNAAGFVLIDDFESYNDDDNRTYDTWIDGWLNGTGSLVGYSCSVEGYVPPVHGGRQTLPFTYNNAVPPYYSEAFRTWDVPQDWTINGVTHLSLWLIGNPVSLLEGADGVMVVARAAAAGDCMPTVNSPADFYVVIEGSAGSLATVVHPDPGFVNAIEWTQWSIPLIDFAGAGVDLTAIKRMYIGVGNRDSPQPDGTGMIYIDDICLIQTPTEFLVVDDFESYDEERKRIYETWIDGWDVTGNGTGSLVGYGDSTGPLTDVVHAGNGAMPFGYDNLDAPYYSETDRTWDVPQDWTANGVTDLSLWVRGPRVAVDTNGRANSPDTLYAALEDFAGEIATVANPDPNVVNAREWLQWRIPLSQFTGVDAKTIRRMYLGVGNRDNPRPGGRGRIYIDDIRVIRPDTADAGEVTGP